MGYVNLGPRTYRAGDYETTLGAPLAKFPQFGRAYYVDGDDGSDSNSGKAPSRAFLTIAAAITAASDGDAIFVMPQAIAATDTDPNSYTENLVIPAAKRLALIGAGYGLAQGAQPQLKVGATTTSPVLTIRSAGCLVAGLSINGAGGTGGGILLDDDSGASKNAFGTVIDSCFFKNCKGTTATSAATGGAIQWPAAGNAWQVRISRNRFYKNVGDIVMKGTTSSVPQDVVIEDNVFSSPAGSVDCNIYVAADGIGGLIINRNVFPVLPAIGSGPVKRFYSLATGCLGIISNNVFGSTALTFGGTNTGGAHPATMFLANNKQQGAVAQEPANEAEIGYTA